jgi:hypothetical protein
VLPRKSNGRRRKRTLPLPNIRWVVIREPQRELIIQTVGTTISAHMQARLIPKYGSEARQVVIEKHENKHDGVVIVVAVLLLRSNHIVPTVTVKQHVIRAVLHHRHCCKNSSVVSPPLTKSSSTKTKCEPKIQMGRPGICLFPEILLQVFLTPHLPSPPLSQTLSDFLVLEVVASF